MTVIALESLPLGFRFHPTDEELVNHYLKPKITGRSKSEVQVIAEIDVCKCEPWDLPDKSVIRSNDPEWFFFAPKDRKYPNGHRANRATEKGYWKATGKDRYIRSKPSGAKSTVIGMKKTLVFHRGRAPKGVRTHWIMHEYRTTEPEFESGDQGGYVLYRLFKKQELENISNSNADEMEMSGFSPTPTKSVPQNEAEVTDEIVTELNHDSPTSKLQEELKSSSDFVQKQPSGINILLAGEDYSNNLSIKAVNNFFNLVSPDEDTKVGEKADPLPDMLAQFFEADEQTDWVAFPMSNTDYPLVGNANQELQIGSHLVANVGDDALNSYLISALNPDDCFSGASIFPKESFVETFPKHGSWESTSCKDSGSGSDIDTEPGLPQGAADSEASGCFYGSTLQTGSLQMDNSVVYPEMNTQLSTLYENASLLPYDITGPDVYSVDFGAESLQDLFNSMDELSNQKTTLDTGDDFGGTGITIRSRPRQTISDNLFLHQGSAIRRIRLQSSVRKAPLGIVHHDSTTVDDNEDKESITKLKDELIDSVEESTTEKNSMSNGDDHLETGIEIKAWRDQHSLNESFTCHSTTLTNYSSHCELQCGSVSDNESGIRDNHDRKPGRTEAGEHLDDQVTEGGESAPPAVVDKFEGLSIHDETPTSSTTYEISKCGLRLRTKTTNESDSMLKHSPLHPKAPRGHSIVTYMICLVSLLVLLLLSFGIWRHIISSPVM
ncbi:hypothetical protein Cni_G03642 [Canna indica]|uniref:NAC domain-containing protein n=1 Tax=Canna indica TaxID=4628 RepID=A0AAQ3JU22_9LILI|nr:hypothetical protein Cni_G03642 [Canna indica]